MAALNVHKANHHTAIKREEGYYIKLCWLIKNGCWIAPDDCCVQLRIWIVLITQRKRNKCKSDIPRNTLQGGGKSKIKRNEQSLQGPWVGMDMITLKPKVELIKFTPFWGQSYSRIEKIMKYLQNRTITWRWEEKIQ